MVAFGSWSGSQSESGSGSTDRSTSNKKSSWKSATKRPTDRPTPWPTKRPTPSPTRYPTRRPTPKPTARPTTSLPTQYIPTNDEFCGCYQLNSACAPTTIHDQICYYYIIESISDQDYCDSITTFTLNTDNHCGLTNTDINGLIMDYAPKCYHFDGLNADGIKFTLGSISSSCNSGSESSSRSWWGGSDSGESSQSDDDSNCDSVILIQENPIIFSICFKEGEVAGFNQNGEIGYDTSNGGSYTCDTPELPNFCL